MIRVRRRELGGTYMSAVEPPARIDRMRPSATAAYVHTTTSCDSRRFSSSDNTKTSGPFVSCGEHETQITTHIEEANVPDSGMYTDAGSHQPAAPDGRRHPRQPGGSPELLSPNHCPIFPFGFVAVTPYHIRRFIQLPGLNNAEPEKTHRQHPAARRDSIEEIHRRVLILPPILPITRRVRLRKGDTGRRALAGGTNTTERLNGGGGGLPWRRDFRDLQLPTDVFKWRDLERLNVTHAQR
jgi:hypothetical protein